MMKDKKRRFHDTNKTAKKRKRGTFQRVTTFDECSSPPSDDDGLTPLRLVVPPKSEHVGRLWARWTIRAVKGSPGAPSDSTTKGRFRLRNCFPSHSINTGDVRAAGSK